MNSKKTWLMTRAFEKAGQRRKELLAAMSMPVVSEEDKRKKVETVKNIYEDLGIGEEAKQEIIRLHTQAMESIRGLGLSSEGSSLLKNYAFALIGRNK